MVPRRVGSHSALPLLLGLAALLSGCVGADGPTLPLGEDASRLAVSARYAAAPAARADEPAPINRIRLTGRSADTGDVLGESVRDVDPDGAPWRVSLDVELPRRAATDVVVSMELIHVEDGVESVEWSGRSEPIRVEAGSAEEVSEVTLYRGPLSNLTVTGVEITGRGLGRLLEGASLKLEATVEAEEGTPVVFWSSTDPEVLEVGEDGGVVGVAPGTARVIAEAGPVADTVELEVLPRAVELEVVAGDGQTADPGTAVDVAPVFRVVNGDGVSVSGEPVTFAVDGTGDELTQTSDVSDDVGEVSPGSWTLGPDAGVRTLTATAEGLEPAEVVAEAAWSLEPAIDVTAGSGFACGLNEHGQVFCWGIDVGDDPMQSPTASSVPVPMGADFRLASLSAGERHVCGLADGGEAYCWGWNLFGQLGDGTTVDAPGPVPVEGGLTFASLDAGAYHNCALTPDGIAHCWGLGEQGALGFDAPDLCNDAACSTEPGAVVEAGAFDQVSAGFEHTCGVGTDGTGHCWGDNGYYQLGLGSSVPDFSVTPQAVTVVSDFRELRAGTTVSCGVDAAGAAHCWGSVTGSEPLATFDVGQLGDGKLDGNFQPEPVIGGLAFRTLAVSQSGDFEAMVTCGIATDDGAYCWGANQHGQLGASGGEVCMPLDVAFDCRSRPGAVTGGHRFVDLGVGPDHVCGVATDGIVYCWGANALGQLGDGSTIPSQAPVRVAAPSEASPATRAPALRLQPVPR